MKLRNIANTAMGALLVIMSGQPVADDIDIYLQPQTVRLPGDVRLWPMVMLGFSIDSEMGSKVCTGEVIDGKPDRETFDAGCDLLIPEDMEPDAFVNANTIAGWPTTNTNGIDGVDGGITITRAGLYAAGTMMVLRRLPDAKMRIGMMIPHDNSPSSETSNGGFIALGFGPTQAQVNANAGGLDCTDYSESAPAGVVDVGGACDLAARKLMQLQNAAYATRLKWIGSMLSGTSNVSHKYAMTELNYELRRYLLGGKVYRGHLGNDDFRTSADMNLRCDDPVPNSDPFPDSCFEFTESYWHTNGEFVFNDPDVATTPAGVTLPYGFTSSPAIFRESDWYDGDLEKGGTKNPVAWDEWVEFTDPNSGTLGYYKSPLVSELICSGVNVINFAKNASEDIADIPNKDDLEDFLSGNQTTVLDPEYMGITLTKGGGDKANNYLHQVLRHLYNMDLLPDEGTPETTGRQNVKSHFVFSTPTLTDDEHLLAISGGGPGSKAYSSSNVSSFIAGLYNIFQEIISQSSTFVAPSVPPSAINRTRSVNEVFMALFSAEKEKFWPGNVKKLRIEKDSDGNWYLAATDEDGSLVKAIEPTTGRISKIAVTYWTRTADSRLNPDNFDPNDATADTDGRQVDRGGSGQQIDVDRFGHNQIAANRTLYTNVGTALEDFSNNIGLDPVPLKWAVGNGRDWRTGDTLHSRPVAINYGARETAGADYTKTNPDIRLVLGTNDGFLRMIRNTVPGGFTVDELRQNGTADIGDAGGPHNGEEVWAFMPMEVKDKIDWLASTTDTYPPRHPITVDGAPVIDRLDVDRNGIINQVGWDHDNNDSTPELFDHVYIYFGLRRGGKYYYALDITNPDVPTLKWVIGKDGVDSDPDNSDGLPNNDFIELAQTWSTPAIGQMKVSGVVKTVLVFGGGYNGDDDGVIGYAGGTMRNGTSFDCDADYWLDPDAPTMSIAEGLGDDAPNRGCGDYEGDDNEGNALFIVDAETGTLIWKLNLGSTMTNINSSRDDDDSVFSHPALRDSVPAEVSAVDLDADGLLDRVYFGDTGGVLWRVNLADNRRCLNPGGNCDVYPDGYPEDDSPGYWHAYPLLSVGRHSSAGLDRRFLTRPDVISSYDASGNYDGVLIGTGDRENPNSMTENEIFIHYKDAFTDSRWSPYLREGAAPTTHVYNTTPVADFNDLALREFREFNDADEYTFLDQTSTEQKIVNGWIMDLPEEGEKVVGHAVTLAGVTYFTTHRPGNVGVVDPNPCIPSAGWGRMYVLGIERGEPEIPDSGNPNDPDQNVAYVELNSPGIPPPIVPVGTEDGVRLLVPGRGGLEDPDADLFFPTFWRREDN